MIKGMTSKLSLKAKFKSSNTIEVVVINHVTGEQFLHLIDLVSGEPKETESKQDLSVKEEISDD